MHVMAVLCFLMNGQPPSSIRTDTLCPFTTLFRSIIQLAGAELAHAEYGKPAVAAGIVGMRQLEVAGGRCIPQQTRGAKVEGEFGETDYQQRSEQHTSELQSLMSIAYAVLWLKTKIIIIMQHEQFIK